MPEQSQRSPKDPHTRPSPSLSTRLREKIVELGIAKVAGGVVGAPALLAAYLIGCTPLGQDEPPKPTPTPMPTPTPLPQPAISVLSDQDRIDDNGVAVGGTYVFADLFSTELEPPPSDAVDSCAGRYAWAQSQGGIVSGVQHLRVTIQLGTLETLSVTSVRPVLVKDETHDPLAGTEVLCSGTGGSGLPTLSVDLTQDRARSSYVDGDGKPTEFYFDVTKGKSATFDVDAVPTACDCTYELEVTTVEDGSKQVRRIRDSSGDPFRVTSSDAAVPVAWELGSEQWLPVESFPASQGPSVEAPATTSSACIGARNAISEALPVGATFEDTSVPFQLTGNDPSLDVEAGFSSICSWILGEVTDDGTIPSATVQDWRFPAAEGTDAFWDNVVNRMSDSGWRSLPGGALLSHDGAVAAWRAKHRILIVTTAPSNGPIARGMMGALLATS